MSHHRLFSLLLISAPLFASGLGCASTHESFDSDSNHALSPSESEGRSLGRSEGVRTSDGATRARFDTQKITYTERGSLTLHAVFDPKSESEGADVPQADLFQANFSVSLSEYVQLFETSDDVVIEPRKGDVYTERAEASGGQGDRTVILRWDNADGANTRQGKLELALDPAGRVTRFQMTKSARTFFGWKTVFDETVEVVAPGEPGLLLLDEGPMGRVTDVASVTSAIDDPSPANFRKLVDR